jgi:hypothetical protein
VGNQETAKAPKREDEREGLTPKCFLRGFSSRHRAFAVSALFAVLIGCCPKKPVARPPYEGPTLSLAEVVSRINENNNRIQTLWASGSFECWVRDEKNQTQYIDGDKLLLAFRKPIELKMAGEKFGAPDRLFEVGSNAHQFWMWFPIRDTMWWGDYHADMPMTYGEIPIRPDLLTEVLGVNDIDVNLLKHPIPVMRFNADEDVYTIAFHTLLPDRMIVQKEVSYDRATLVPKSIAFYDANGRVVLRANLSEHEHLNSDPNAPSVATHFEIEFLQTHAKLVLKLRELKDSYKGRPNDATFHFPGADAAGKSYKVDEAPAQQPLQ